MDFRSDSGSSWLAALIAPVSPDEFVSRYWARQPLFCRGSADRFATLLSWTVLNELLALQDAGLLGPVPITPNWIASSVTYTAVSLARFSTTPSVPPSLCSTM